MEALADVVLAPGSQTATFLPYPHRAEGAKDLSGASIRALIQFTRAALL